MSVCLCVCVCMCVCFGFVSLPEMILRSRSGVFPVYVHSVKLSAPVPALLLLWFWEQAGESAIHLYIAHSSRLCFKDQWGWGPKGSSSVTQGEGRHPPH